MIALILSETGWGPDMYGTGKSENFHSSCDAFVA